MVEILALPKRDEISRILSPSLRLISDCSYSLQPEIFLLIPPKKLAAGTKSPWQPGREIGPAKFSPNRGDLRGV
jgi:hypothetical protein